MNKTSIHKLSRGSKFFSCENDKTELTFIGVYKNRIGYDHPKYGFQIDDLCHFQSVYQAPRNFWLDVKEECKTWKEVANRLGITIKLLERFRRSVEYPQNFFDVFGYEVKR